MSVATEDLNLTSNRDVYELLDYMSFWKESDQTLTIETVSDPANQHHFKALKGSHTRFGFRQSAVWARLQIHNSCLENLWFIVLGDSINMRTADRIDLYKPNPNGGFDQFKDGEDIPLDQTMIPQRAKPTFWIHINTGQTQTFYLRIQDEGLATLPLVLGNKRAGEKKTGDFLWFSILGAFGFFIVYNLLLYTTLKDRVFLYFSLMLVSIPLFYFASKLSFFAPNLDCWWDNRIKETTRIFYRMGWLLLTKNYFQLKEPNDWLNKWINGLITWVLILSIALFLLPYNWVAWVSTISRVIVTLSFLSISIIAWRRGFDAGIYYIMAVSLVFLQVCMGSLNDLGFIFSSTYQNLMSSLFFFLLSLFFCSLALIDRHNILSRQMLSAQKRSMESLKQSEQAKDEFLANTSHELRTPLHGIIGLCENLLIHGKKNIQATWDQDLNIIIHCTRRLSTLVDDILDFTRIRQGNIRMTIRPVDIESVLKLTLTLCRPLIGEKKIQLRMDTQKKLPPILADENRLQQILLNLIKNAIKFTQEGEIVISAVEQGSFLKINVQDTGIGIPETKHTEIFNRFVQIDSAIDRKYGGVGLGLAITRQLVELQKGEITVSNADDGGACFSFTLPLADKSAIIKQTVQPILDTDNVNMANTQPSIVPLPELPKTPPANDGICILIVDDEPISLHALHNHLSTAAYQVYAAPDVDTARKLMRTYSFDLAVLDIMMPHTNGYEFCQELRQTFNPTELPVIMLTARTQPEDLLRGFECGANDYLTKPVERRELLTRIQTSLKLKSLVDLLRENKGLKEEIVRRRRAEHSLEGANRQLAALLNLWESALILVDGQDRVLYNNEHAEKLFGYPSHSLVNRSLQQVFPKEKGIIPKKNINILFETQDTTLMRSQNSQFTTQTPDGRTLKVETLATPITVDDQTIWALIFRDIKESEDKAKVLSDEQAALALAQHQKKIQALQEAFGSALKYLDQEGQQLNDELTQIDCSLVDKLRNMPQETLEQHYRKTLVTLMTETITCWTQIAGTDKIALAEQSGIWRTYLDVSTYKTRTLDKYLNTDKLPKNPRWKDVLKTIDFVTATCGQDHPAVKNLNTSLLQFKTVLKAKQFV